MTWKWFEIRAVETEEDEEDEEDSYITRLWRKDSAHYSKVW